MPIELPNLDNKSFTDLVEEGRRLIPGYAPSWTDHNVSDPGITFIELFASVTEILLYRVNRVTAPSKRAFVQLLDPGHAATPGWTVDQEISAAINRLRTEERAVTAADFAKLATATPGAARAACLPRRNLEASGNAANTEAPGHISVLVVSTAGSNAANVRAAVAQDLEKRCLVATQLHVVAPALLSVAVNLTLRIQPDQLADIVEARALAALGAFFDPLAGGPDGEGWPFGAAVYRADIYAILDRVEGVDYVDLKVSDQDVFVVGGAAGARNITPVANYVGLHLEPNELVAFSPSASTIDCLPADTGWQGQ